MYPTNVFIRVRRRSRRCVACRGVPRSAGRRVARVGLGILEDAGVGVRTWRAEGRRVGGGAKACSRGPNLAVSLSFLPFLACPFSHYPVCPHFLCWLRQLDPSVEAGGSRGQYVPARAPGLVTPAPCRGGVLAPGRAGAQAEPESAHPVIPL